MAESHSANAELAGKRRDGDAGLDSVFRGAMSALPLPVAILGADGEVLAFNESWSETAGAFGGHAAAILENYLDWCAGLENRVGAQAVARAVNRVLTGRETGCDQNFLVRAAGTRKPVRVRVDRVGDGEPARFLISHEFLDPVRDDIEARVLSAQIEERERLAAELHDSVGQNLLCLDLGLTRLSRLAPATGEVSAIIADMAASLHQAHAEIRTLSFLLHPPWLEQRGAFVDAIRDLVAGFARRSGLEAGVDIVGFPCRLTSAQELTLFRVLQEALVNVHRHARARSVEVEMARRGANVVLKVQDDGVGMAAGEAATPGGGVGLSSMRQRLRQLGGDLRIVSGLDGATLVAKLPV